MTALNKSFPYASLKADSKLPALITLAPVPLGMVANLRGLVEKLELDDDLVSYLSDSVFIASKDESTLARLFENLGEVANEEKRHSQRFKAEMLVLQSKIDQTTIVPLQQLLGESLDSPRQSESLSESIDSILPDETYATTEDGEMAMTPEMEASAVLPAIDEASTKSSVRHERGISPSRLAI